MERSLLDLRHSVYGALLGGASFRSAGPSLLYEENGALQFGSHSGAAEQHYLYDFDDDPTRACVRFRDGRPFHDLDLHRGRAAVSYLCGADVYEGRFTVIDETRWQSSWTIKGPRKDQEILTHYSLLT